jgi:TRAP-type C4-dicarboxylate transport system permease small subunit
MNSAAAKIQRMSALLTKVFFLVLVLLGYRLWSSVSKNLTQTNFQNAIQLPQALPLAGFSLLAFVASFYFRRVYSRVRPAASAVANANRAFMGHLLALLLGESIALCGLKLGLDSGCFYVALPFFFTAAVLYAVHWPSRGAT